jgi:hypothetical protein
MLLTLILNLGMAAGDVVEATPVGGGGGGYNYVWHEAMRLPGKEERIKKQNEAIIKVLETFLNVTE